MSRSPLSWGDLVRDDTAGARVYRERGNGPPQKPISPTSLAVGGRNAIRLSSRCRRGALRGRPARTAPLFIRRPCSQSRSRPLAESICMAAVTSLDIELATGVFAGPVV